MVTDAAPRRAYHVAVVGGGNFGTAIADIVAQHGNTCALWMRDAAQAHEVQATRENRRYLPGYRLHDALRVTSDAAAALDRVELVFVTVPSESFRAVSRMISPLLPPQCMLVSGTKGIEWPGFHLMSAILEQECVGARVGAISGPNLAEEIAAREITATVIASPYQELNRAVQLCLHGQHFRVYDSQDHYGVQLAGALKNIYAIVCGMAAGLGVGQNTVGLLVTRALAEMSRFAVSLGANPLTFLGLAGVGDLLVTCTSPLSRNYQLGYRIARGATLDAAMESLGKLAEGVNTLRVVCAKARESEVYMPIAGGLHRVLFDGLEVATVVATLMASDQGVDVEFATSK